MEEIKNYISGIMLDHLRDSREVSLYKDVEALFEKPLIEMTLKYTRYNQTKCAKVLGVNRGTLRKKCQKYSIDCNIKREASNDE